MLKVQTKKDSVVNAESFFIYFIRPYKRGL